MKRKLSFTLIFLFASIFTGFAQSENTKPYMDKNDVAGQYPAVLKYTDPYFPIFTGSGNPYDNISYKNKMEEYAKLNPPCPRIKNTGDPAFDNLKLKNAIDDWYAIHPFFPRFIEYHRFNFLLTPEDDIILYNNAISVWKEKNPNKVEEVFGTNTNNSK